MVEKISEIKKHVEPLKKHALAILLYGSCAKGEATNRGDIDICIVAPSANREDLYRDVLKLSRDRYDIRVFEDMPLFLKAEVIKNHKILYAKDVLDLYEYLYRFRKIWEDQKHRQRLEKEDIESFLM